MQHKKLSAHKVSGRINRLFFAHIKQISQNAFIAIFSRSKSTHFEFIVRIYPLNLPFLCKRFPHPHLTKLGALAANCKAPVLSLGKKGTEAHALPYPKVPQMLSLPCSQTEWLGSKVKASLCGWCGHHYRGLFLLCLK